MTTIPAEQLAKIFVEISDTLIDEFDLPEFLHTLADRTAALLDAAAVGLMLTDQDGTLQFMAASHENVRLLELFQIQSREGPCLDAYRTATAVINTDLNAAGARWPRFAPHATSTGYRSVHAFPLRLRQDVIGAMNVFGTHPGKLDPSDIHIIQALADVASIGILQERTIAHGEILTEQLQGALNSRIIIEQAKGAIAQANNISVDAAFTLIRTRARRTNQPLGTLARAIVTDLTALPDLTPDKPAGPA